MVSHEKRQEADHADDLVLLRNIPDQTESLLHSLEQTAGGISHYVNANQTEYMCFKEKGAISTKWQASKISRPVHIPQ